MIRRRLWTSLLGIVVAVAALLVVNLATRNEPVLGLDLQGGVSVVLATTEEANNDDLLTIRDLIRDELEGRGIAEPDVRVEGDNIVVDLPGVKDQRAALRAVDVAGIVTLRPVEGQCVPAEEATSSEPADTSEPPADSEPADSETPPGPIGPNTFDPGEPSPFTPPPPDAVDTSTTLPDRDGFECPVGAAQRGPSGELSGYMFPRGSADVRLNGAEWVVDVGLTAAGQNTFQTMASACLNRDPSCPTGQIAIVMDDVIQSAPVVQTADFSGGVTISGASMSQRDAEDLARVINRGAFPVQVRAENVQTVSATLGADSLEASVVAGLAGIVLVLVLLSYFYRRLVLIVIAGLVVWGTLIYSAAAIVSQTTNFALSLAGVAGIVVAIGITVDTYVVYFERLKDEVRHGRTIRNAASRSFKATWRTILAADFVSLLASSVLFALSVGSVRGFALYLGITTICDMIVFFFFTRPAVGLLADNGWLDEGDTFGLKEYA